MSTLFIPKVVTANHLLNGEVIYFTTTHAWSPLHTEAACYTDSASTAQGLASAQQQPHIAVDPYLVEVRLNAAGQPEPIHFREQFRTRGPSNYAHGKQVDR